MLYTSLGRLASWFIKFVINVRVAFSHSFYLKQASFYIVLRVSIIGPIILDVYFSHVSCTVSRDVASEASNSWLDTLQSKDVPMLVCLTYADKFYAEQMGNDSEHPEESKIKQALQRQLQVIKYSFALLLTGVWSVWILACQHEVSSCLVTGIS